MATDNVEATSLLGMPLHTPTFPDGVREKLEGQWAEAKAAYDAQPDDADAILLLGQRAGYLGRMRDAIAAFTEGIAKHPTDARFPRYRGHRFISMRRFAEAATDLDAAARLAAGQPPLPEYPAGAAKDQPTTYTIQFSIWYHLGLAHYLAGDFAAAAQAYAACAEYAVTDETTVAVTHWRYMTLRRLGDAAEAERVLEPIHPNMAITENRPYHRLTLLYTGAISPEAVLAPDEADADKGVGSNQALMDATAGYGVGNWHLYGGRPTEAEAVFRHILTATPPGMAQFAFGYIAAEAASARGSR